jgi:uncharacterized membrane protein YoaK (UPF0700 family)
MLATRAYSFRRQARLAISLGWVAGFVNAITFLECAHLFVSHMTGAVAQGGIDAASGRWDAALLMGEILVCFVLGAAASALLAEGARRSAWHSRFSAPIALEAALLAVMCLLLELDMGVPRVVVGMAAFAMGLQNATITQISGAVVRTTHLTGVVTDLGLETVQAWFWWRDPTRRVRPVAPWRFFSASTWHPRMARLVLLLSLVGAFLLGVVCGAWGHALAPRLALLAPVLFLLVLVVLGQRVPMGEIRALDPVAETDLAAQGLPPLTDLPPGVGVFWLGRSRPVGMHPGYEGRSIAHLAPPDFEAWGQRLPPTVKEVVLLLSHHVVLDTNAALDLDHVARRLHEAGRRLWLVGLTDTQHAVLAGAGAFPVVGDGHVVADLATALERLRGGPGGPAPRGLGSSNVV